MSKPLHILKYGSHSEQRHFMENLDAYDQVLISGSTAAYFQAGMSVFLAKLKNAHPAQRVLLAIDPQTPAFQDIAAGADLSGTDQDNDDISSTWRVKPSLASLADVYGGIVHDCVESCDPLTPEQVSEDLDSMCDNVLRFQVAHLDDALKATEDYKYLKYAQLDTVIPAVLLAPYFFMAPDSVDEWLETNLHVIQTCIDIAKTRYSGFDLAAVLAIGPDTLGDPTELKTVIDGYSELGVEQLFVWFDDFDETTAINEQLEGLCKLLTKLVTGTHPKRIINLFGGYFSTLLCHQDIGLLAGVCHGPGYGEYRSVFPVGGGIPYPKFYIPQFHNRFIFREGLRAVTSLVRDEAGKFSRQHYLDEVCSCDTCQSVVSDPNPSAGFLRYGQTKRSIGRDGIVRMFPTAEASLISTRHYLQTKHLEFQILNGKTLPEHVEDLRSAYLFGKTTLGTNRVKYLDRWASIIQHQFLSGNQD